ncbi:hypothetical protein PHMEG_00018609, partial [Phytophthora megakarya]
PSFVYLPAATEDIQALATGNPSGLRFRDVRGLIHVGVRVPELTVPQLEALSRLVSADDRTPTDILTPEHLSGGSPSAAWGHRAQASEVQAGPLLNVFGSSRFGYRVLNTLHALRLALDRLRLLETAQNLATSADPRSEMTNAILQQVLEREVVLREARDREWEAALREVDVTTLSSYQGFCDRTRAIIHAEVQHGATLASRLEPTETRYLDADRALTEARGEASKASNVLNAAEKALVVEREKVKTLQAVRTEVSRELVSAKTQLEDAQAQLASRPAVIPGGAVPQAEHDAEVRRLSRRIRKLRVANQDLRTEIQRFRTLLSPDNLFRFFNDQGSPGVMTGATELREQLSAYYQPPYSVFLMVSRNNAPPPPFQPTQVESEGEDSDDASSAASDKECGVGGGDDPSTEDSGKSQSLPMPAFPKKCQGVPLSNPAKAAAVPKDTSSHSTGSEALPSPPPQGNSLLRPDPEISGATILGHLFDADYDMGGGDDEERRTPQEEKREEDSPMDGNPGARDPPESEDVEIEGVSKPGPRMSADGLRQVRPTVYVPQTDPKGGVIGP